MPKTMTVKERLEKANQRILAEAVEQERKLRERADKMAQDREDAARP